MKFSVWTLSHLTFLSSLIHKMKDLEQEIH